MIKITGNSSDFVVETEGKTYYGQLIEMHDDETETWGIYEDAEYNNLIRENTFDTPVLDEGSLLDVVNDLMQEYWTTDDVEIEFE